MSIIITRLFVNLELFKHRCICCCDHRCLMATVAFCGTAATPTVIITA